MITANKLAEELLLVFGTWVGTPSEELLENGGHVIDHLCTVGNKYGRDELEALPQSVWEEAWSIFDSVIQK